MKRPNDIKRAQKASQLMRIICTLFSDATRDDVSLHGVMISRVDLSPDKSTCYVLFYTPEGEEAFKAVLQRLILYKPSLRAAIAKQIPSRYTPELVFKFDHAFAKAERVENLLTQLKDKGEL